MQENKGRTNGLILKWGNEVFDDGVTNLPTCVARYGRRFMNGTEFSFVITLVSYKFNEGNPFPSQKTLANDMGLSVRAIEKAVQSLFEKDLIEVVERYDYRGKTSNEYSVFPLVQLCLDLSQKDKEEKEREKGIKRKSRPKKKDKIQYPNNHTVTEGCRTTIRSVAEQPYGNHAEQPYGNHTEQPYGQRMEVEEGNYEEGNRRKSLSLHNSSNTYIEDIDEELALFLKSDFFKKREREIKGLNLSDILQRWETLKQDMNAREFIITLDYLIKNNEHVKDFATLFRIVNDKIRREKRHLNIIPSWLQEQKQEKQQEEKEEQFLTWDADSLRMYIDIMQRKSQLSEKEEIQLQKMKDRLNKKLDQEKKLLKENLGLGDFSNNEELVAMLEEKEQEYVKNMQFQHKRKKEIYDVHKLKKQHEVYLESLRDYKKVISSLATYDPDNWSRRYKNWCEEIKKRNLPI